MGVTWIHSDHLHSATILTDDTGAEVRRLAYRAFGEELENTGSGTDPTYSYTGPSTALRTGPRDASGLMYYGARYYDPALSRFITPDTVYDAGPQGLNRYSYVLNNPIIYHDPTGHEHWYEPYTNAVADAHERVNVQLDQLDEASGYHPAMIGFNDGVVKTVYDVGFGIVESGAGLIPLGEQFGEWGADLKNPNKIPVFGPASKNLVETIAAAIEDPSVETVSAAVAAAAEVVGIVAGGVQFARMKGVPGTKGNPTKVKLPDKLAETFMGNKYTSRVLDNDLILYRAGTKTRPLGEFFTETPPVSEIQVRIDQAVLPKWPNGGTSPIDTGFKVKIPKGTTIYEGTIGPQGDIYLGGTKQIIVQKPWTIQDVEVLDSFPLTK